jgi:urea transport system substrate-binding protein
MDATNWTAIISKMRRANPGAIIMSTAGGAPNVTLQRQYKAAGMQALVGNLSVDELTAQSMGKDAADIYISASYFSGINNDGNRGFSARMKGQFGSQLLLPNDLSVPQYDAIYLYKAAVEKAGTTDAEAVIKALPEVSYDGPRGKVQMNRQRHAALTMHLGRVRADGKIDVIHSFKDVDPGEQCPGP